MLIGLEYNALPEQTHLKNGTNYLDYGSGLGMSLNRPKFDKDPKSHFTVIRALFEYYHDLLPTGSPLGLL